MIRSYLDWLLAVPWSKRSDERLDHSHTREVLDEDHLDPGALEIGRQRARGHQVTGADVGREDQDPPDGVVSRSRRHSPDRMTRR